MTTFDEREHPRATSGQFADKAQGAPEVSLSTAAAEAPEKPVLTRTQKETLGRLQKYGRLTHLARGRFGSAQDVQRSGGTKTLDALVDMGYAVHVNTPYHHHAIELPPTPEVLANRSAADFRVAAQRRSYIQAEIDRADRTLHASAATHAANLLRVEFPTADRATFVASEAGYKLTSLEADDDYLSWDPDSATVKTLEGEVLSPLRTYMKDDLPNVETDGHTLRLVIPRAVEPAT